MTVNLNVISNFTCAYQAMGKDRHTQGHFKGNGHYDTTRLLHFKITMSCMFHFVSSLPCRVNGLFCVGIIYAVVSVILLVDIYSTSMTLISRSERPLGLNMYGVVFTETQPLLSFVIPTGRFLRELEGGITHGYGSQPSGSLHG